MTCILLSKKKLAKKYYRKLYVVNQLTLTDPYASPYNPFDGLSPTQVKAVIKLLINSYFIQMILSN